MSEQIKTTTIDQLPEETETQGFYILGYNVNRGIGKRTVKFAFEKIQKLFGVENAMGTSTTIAPSQKATLEMIKQVHAALVPEFDENLAEETYKPISIRKPTTTYTINPVARSVKYQNDTEDRVYTVFFRIHVDSDDIQKAFWQLIIGRSKSQPNLAWSNRITIGTFKFRKIQYGVYEMLHSFKIDRTLGDKTDTLFFINENAGGKERLDSTVSKFALVEGEYTLENPPKWNMTEKDLQEVILPNPIVMGRMTSFADDLGDNMEDDFFYNDYFDYGLQKLMKYNKETNDWV